MKKKILALLLVGGMLLSSVVTANASTTSELTRSLRNNLWYNTEANAWQFYVDHNPVKNQIINYHDVLFYFDENGNTKNGWINFNNNWYYGSQMMGKLLVNQWTKSGNNWYYFENDGKMVTTTTTIKGKTYNFASDGHWIG